MSDVARGEPVELEPFWLLSDEQPDWRLLPDTVEAIVLGDAGAMGFTPPLVGQPGSGLPDGVSPRQLLGALRDMFRRQPAGQVVVAKHRAIELVPVLWVAAPATAGCSVAASWGLTRSSKGKLSVTLGPVSGGMGVSYTAAHTDELEVGPGEAERGWLELPVWKETRMVVPPGGYEAFPVNHYWPDHDREQGFKAEVVTADQIPASYPGNPAALTASSTLKGSMTSTVSVDAKLSIGFEGQGSGRKLGASAAISGEVEVAASWELSAGRYQRYLLTGPPGCAIV